MITLTWFHVSIFLFICRNIRWREIRYEIILKSLDHYKKRLQTIHQSPELQEAGIKRDYSIWLNLFQNNEVP